MFYRGSCVFFRTISLPSFNGLCCKLAEITLFICMMQGRSQDFSRGGGQHCVKVRVLTRLSLWPRYCHGIFATCSGLFG